MTLQIRHRISLLALTLAVTVPMGHLRGQRLPGNMDARAKMIVRGSRNPIVDTLPSEGPVDDTMRIAGMSFRFRPTPAQSAELERHLEQQQDPASPLFHKWLTPEEYGSRFGLGQEDLTSVTGWLTSQGFRVDYVPKSRSYITFSGTAGQVRDAFSTEVHQFTWRGKARFANIREIMVPAELVPLVYPPTGLDDLREEPMLKTRPLVTWKDGSHSLTPGDLAVIYNLVPLYKKGINGAGQKIVVVGAATLELDDVRAFREIAGLPPNEPKTILAAGSKDPGMNMSLYEALLDVEYAGGAAPGATIVYVYATDPIAAMVYAIDQNIAPVISVSFGACEKINKSAGDLIRNIAQQAVAQGITLVAGSGDNGAACPAPARNGQAILGMGLALPSSVPEVTAIGGTTFDEGNGRYWSPDNNGSGVSALSYIPEKVWNDSAVAKFPAASGGGPSVIYSRPVWQNSPKLPNDNVRHVPDLALAASFVHDPYVVVQDGEVKEVGGTSAGTPFFAGVVALLNEYVVYNGIQDHAGLGNINPRLYQLANTPGVFHDITAGDNVVPCQKGSPDCTTGQFGYSAGDGYDDATGLGSIDAATLFEKWSDKPSTPKSGSVVMPTVDPNPVYQQTTDADGDAWFYTIKLTETGGAPTTITGFSIDSYDLSDYVEAWFGSKTLPANGTLSADLLSRNMQVPSDHIFAFAGVDANGQKWSKQSTVSFLGHKPANEKGAALK